MKDIDFDELDRAVSSLMGSVPKDNPAKDTDDDDIVKPSAITDSGLDEVQVVSASDEEEVSSLDEEPVVVEKTDEEFTEESNQPPVNPARGIAPPTRGRFMDMVRPSREMRSPSSLTSRQGVTLQPSSMPSIDSVPPIDESDTSAVEEQSNEEPSADLAAMVQELEDTASMVSSFGEPAVESSLVIEESSPEEANDTSPLSYPFLPGAKVEKRPLGRPTENATASDSTDEDTESMDLPIADLSPIKAEESSASVSRDAQRPEDPLPAELDSKLLSIETEDYSVHQQDTENQGEPVMVPTAHEVSSPPVEEKQVVVAADEARRTLAAASIPQQYKLETGSSSDVPAAGGIYDAQPLAHPAKSTPGWVWLIGIIGILALGAAGGAAVYFLGLL